MKKIEDFKDAYGVLGVYGIFNTVSKKWYFGSSISKGRFKGIGGRLKRHMWELNRQSHSNIHLQLAFNKYGEVNFEFYLIEKIEFNLDLVREREKHYIKLHEGNIYNMQLDTSLFAGLPWSEERKQKQSGVNHFFYKKRHTNFTKSLISQNRKGITSGFRHHLYGIGHTKATKEKMSKSHSLLIGDKNPFFGKHHTEETKQKLSEIQKNIQTKNGHPMLGKNHTDDSKSKQAMAKVSKAPKLGSFKGVNVNNKKFRAVIYINKKRTLLGDFDSIIEAAKNYDFYAKLIYPKGVYLNFSDFDYSTFEPKKLISKVICDK